MGVMALIFWMKKNGYTDENYEFLDLELLRLSDDEIRAALAEIKPDIVGISATVSNQYIDSKIIARISRDVLPNSLIVLGGNLSAAADVVLHRTNVDVVVVGDGEIPFLSLLNTCKPILESNGVPRDQENWIELISRIPGLAYLNANKKFCFNGYPPEIPASEMEMPDIDITIRSVRGDLALLEEYGLLSVNLADVTKDGESRVLKGVSLFPTKGCVAHCTFCQRATKGFRVVNLEKVEKFLIQMKERFGIEYVDVDGEHFGANKEWSFNFARLMKKLNLYWASTSFRADSFDLEQMKFLREHNCVRGSWGFESGSVRILNLMEKRIRPEQQVACMRNLINADIMPHSVNIMLGYPGETDETVAETGRVLGEMCYIVGYHPSKLASSFLMVWWVQPFHGTPLYDYAKATGAMEESIDADEGVLISIYDYKYNVGRGNMVNINGAPIKEMLFWEHLLRNEAARKFEELDRAKKAVPTWQGKYYFEMEKRSAGYGTPRRFIRDIITGWAPNLIYSILPRKLVYGVLREAQHLLYKKKSLQEDASLQKGPGQWIKAKSRLNTDDMPLQWNVSSSLRGMTRKGLAAELNSVGAELRQLRDAR